MSTAKKKKIPRIQGLRGVAVSAVVLFHAGAPINGGYLGVDMFFVISGYVISRMLYSEYQTTNTVNIRRFFKHRIMRLAPASSAVVIFSLTAGYLYLSNESLKISSWTGLSNIFSIANFSTYFFTKDYFSAPATSNIFLHFWSLAVEEQFYLMVAISIVILRHKHLKTLLRNQNFFYFYLITALSFGAFLMSFQPALSSSKLLNFYSPIPRIWEFSVGIIVLIFEKKKLKVRNDSKILTLLPYLFLCSALAFGKSESIYRAPSTVIAVLSTAYLIKTVNNENRMHDFLLANPLVLVLGNFSYSLYLWHWPIIALVNKIFPNEISYVILSLISVFIISIFTFYFIENFFIKRYDKKFAFALSLLILVTALLFSSLVLIQFRVTQVTSIENDSKKGVFIGDTGHETFHESIEKNNYPCLPISIRLRAVNEGLLRCWQSKPGTEQDLAIIGDSHAEHLFPGISEVLPERNVVYFDTLGKPIFGIAQADRILNYVAKSKTIKVVVLNSFWSVRGVPDMNLQKSVRHLLANGKHIILTDDVPSFSQDPYYCKYPPFGKRRLSLCEQAESLSFKSLNNYSNSLKNIAIENTGVDLVSTFKSFCKDLTCSMVRDDLILYRDSNHLNLEGSRIVGELMKESIEKNLK